MPTTVIGRRAVWVILMWLSAILLGHAAGRVPPGLLPVPAVGVLTLVFFTCLAWLVAPRQRTLLRTSAVFSSAGVVIYFIALWMRYQLGEALGETVTTAAAVMLVAVCFGMLASVGLDILSATRAYVLDVEMETVHIAHRTLIAALGLALIGLMVWLGYF